MVRIDNQNILISHDEITSHTFTRPFSKLFPSAKFRSGVWYLPNTPQILADINEEFNTNLFTTELPVLNVLFSNRTFKTSPFHHQLSALNKCNKASAFAYFLEPGLGKTKILIDDAEILYEECLINSVIVVCPKSAMPVWEREIEKHSSLPHVIQIWPDTCPGGVGLLWYIVNIDALITTAVMITRIKKEMTQAKLADGLEEKLNELRTRTDDAFSVCDNILNNPSMMVIDESTTIANSESKRHRMCMLLGTKAKYRRILTGDPIANTPVDLFGQLRWLDPGCMKYKNIWSFKYRYCIMGGYNDKEILGYRHTEELKRTMDKIGQRTRTVDVMDMPEQNWIPPLLIKPPGDLKKMYDEIVENEILSLFDGEHLVSASMVITKMGKLFQLCGGTLIDDKKETHIIHTYKIQELMRMMQDWGSIKTLIWCHYRGEVDLLYRSLKDHYVVGVYTGDMNVKQRKETEENFENGHFDVLILQDDTGHMSITLNKATHAIFYSNHQRPLVRSQAERRNWRIGQHNPVFYYDILFKGLIDETLYNNIRNKRQFNELITDRITKSQIMEIVYDKVQSKNA